MSSSTSILISDEIDFEAPSFQSLLQLDMAREFVMLNMLRFNDVATYQPTDPEYSQPRISGREAYLRYFMQNRPNSAPGGIIFEGSHVQMLIAPPNERWDLIFLRKYESLGSFVDMIRKPAYLEVSRHRKAAVADSRLIATFPGTFRDELAKYAG